MDTKDNEGFVDDEGNPNIINVKPIVNPDEIIETTTEQVSNKNLPVQTENPAEQISVTLNQSEVGIDVEPTTPIPIKSTEKSDEKKEVNPVSGFKLFRYATALDGLLILIGSIGAILNGCAVPASMLFFTNIIGVFDTNGAALCNVTINLTNYTEPDLNGPLRTQAINLSILASAMIVFGYFQVTFWTMAAERQSRIIRKKLYQSILRQNIGWFDTYKTEQLTNRLTEDVNKIKDGISDKFGNSISFITTFISGIALSFYRGWKLTLVVLAVSPLLFALSMAFTLLLEKLTKNELGSYAIAGAVADEVFSSIRTVLAFNGGKKEHRRYEKNLEVARKTGIKKGTITGILMGLLWMTIFCSYALGFWYGWKLSTESDFSVSDLLLVFFTVITAVFTLGNAAPFLTTFASAKAAAYEIFEVIDRVPEIDSKSTKGKKLDDLIGNIEFKDINFTYPARKEVQVMNGLSLKIKSGQTVALVGSSGCGKSTTVQLLQRFYDTCSGIVSIDGINIRDLNLNWMRNQIGVVSQEPVLFALSIKENIRYGKEMATDEEIIKAAKNANAHNFIMQLPKQYDTLVGDRGSQLSGGQKQRIAIARALIRNPKILILDEATSALDTESERIVQDALDKASLGRTTIVIAHRLSTIRNSDVIFALDKGKVVEYGTHNELIDKQGAYYSLTLQSGSQATKTEEKDNNEKSEEKSRAFTKSLEFKKKDNDLKEKDEDKKAKEDINEVGFGQVLKLNSPEWSYIVIGCIASIINGAANPVFAILLSKVINVFQKCDIDEQRKDITVFCLMFVGTGVVTLLGNILQSSMFAISGENLTKRIRSRCFKALLSQPIEYFDNADNNVGVLTTRLAVEAASVQSATGVRIGMTLMNIANLGVGVVLSLYYGWAIALLIIGFIPFLILSGVVQTKMIAGFAAKDKETLEEAGKITHESIANMRTVALLNKEDYFYEAYSDKLDLPRKNEVKMANFVGFMFGFSNAVMFYAIAASFVFGGWLIEEKLFGLDFQKIMLVFSCITFGAQGVGQASAFMPDAAKAKVHISNIFKLFDIVPKINNWENDEGIIPDEKNSDEISVEAVNFTYPNRAEVQILKNMNLNIKKGQRIALVGSSGCGKSTITQLLERFYDPDEGRIVYKGEDIKNMNLFWLRSQIGTVSQEPILFDMTIAENIAYGDNARKIELNEIIEVAKKANIHEFITSLPLGYDTNVGAKGTQLSGGQKQRVSIARALIRNPKILLLDEATSALDNESERIVQDALNKAQEGRTCIVIAHRLSTIRDCDAICVIDDGKICEIGTHDELMNMNGFYAKLNREKN